MDDVVALDHTYGCGDAIHAPGAAIPIQTLHNISRNPNFSGAMIMVSLGCEKLQPSLLFPELTDPAGTQSIVMLQDQSHVGFEAMVASTLQTVERHFAKLNRRCRETCPASELVVGFQCGGGDAFSGLTANPVLGHAADLIVRACGTVVYSEVTEVRDGIDELVRRAATPDIARELVA